MEAAFQMVRQVVVFLLLAALLTNLFMGTEYKKYFTYVTSLIVFHTFLQADEFPLSSVPPAVCFPKEYNFFPIPFLFQKSQAPEQAQVK